MKLTQLSLSAMVILFMASCMGCNDDESPTTNDSNNSGNEIPDLVVNIVATENGSELETISFTAPKQNVSTSSANGSYNATADNFALNVVGQVGAAGPNFTFFGSTGGVKTGTYNVTGDQTICAFTTSAPMPFTATSGEFKITKADLFADVGVGLKEYFCDFEFNGTFKSADGSRTITVTGTVTGANIKTQ